MDDYDQGEREIDPPSGDPPSGDPPSGDPPVVENRNDIDGDTLRIMLSTDNHLGYCEKDSIRGLDSFAAFEEVLALSKRYKCDLVLLAGDLFHDNKPTRRTMHKAMEIIRRYCMGPNPVQVQVVSDQSANFRSVNGTVNYEDEHYSVDLPIFSIHGNHDDPTRDGGTEMLAALDLLAVSNLVNYFGRHDEVDKVEVSPVLLRKGSTRVALYGMGGMRDERLNRMWQGKKVRFLRPESAATEEDDQMRNEEEDDEGKWFNIFALHQNRDLGRGAKNCVHESMIPEWMDLVVWGHEHECQIEIGESAVGTYRITQPGSSVATSLTGGEAVRKQVGILDVKGDQFRMQTVPLSQVRAFSMGEVSLQDHGDTLDPEDPKVDEKVGDFLAAHVTRLVEEAREKSRVLREDAQEAARAAAQADDFEGESQQQKQKFKLEKPDQVLVRLKVEHTGFATLNNQRFGSRFVKDVANASDLLLFHRRRHEGMKEDSKSRSKASLLKPLAPDELEEMNVEDLVKDNLETSDKKLEILDEQRLGVALEDFVSKEQRQAINDTVSEILKKQQTELIKRADDGKAQITTSSAVREVCAKGSEQARVDAAEGGGEPSNNGAAVPPKKKKKEASLESDEEDYAMFSPDKGSSLGDDGVASTGKRGRNAASAKKTTAKKPGRPPAARATGRKRSAPDSDDEVAFVGSTPASKSSRQTSRQGPRPSRRAAPKTRGKYAVDDNDSADMDDSDAVISDEDDEELSDVEIVEKPKRGRPPSSARKTARKSTNPPSATKRGRGGSSARKTPAPSRGRKKKSSMYDDDDSYGDVAGSLGGDWGTANTDSSPTRRRRR